MKHRLSDFTYVLPPAKIAQVPNPIRGQAKLLVVDRTKRSLTDRAYADIVEYIPAGDVLVLNDVKVIPARLYGHPPGKQATIELLLLRKTELPHQWEALIGNKQRLGTNTSVIVEGHELVIESFQPDGRVYLTSPQIEHLAQKHGHIPLPKYIKREDTKEDRKRYQTVFARHEGAVAAPTASLNLTAEMLGQLKAKGVQIVYLTLYVGLGTFAPIRTEFIEDHQIHTEYAEVPAESARVIQQAKAQGRAVWAVGTTVTRTLEAVFRDKGKIAPFAGDVSIFIYPSYEFGVVDHLVTNFHAPHTSVLLLAATFAGKELLFKAYDHALNNNYRFLSYGDSMLIL